MKHIFMPLAAALAILLGAMLPKGYLILQDHQLKEPISHRVEEPMLQYDEMYSTDTAVFGLDSSSDAIAWRLSSFQIGAPTIVPLRSTQKDMWTERAVEFLSDACEVPVEVVSLETVCRLALFGDGTAVPFRMIWIEFNQHWQCYMAIDDASGIILCFDLHSGISDLSELFPDSFEQGTTEPDAAFEALASRRVAYALSDMMGAGIQVLPGEAPDTAVVRFDDNPDLQLALQFTLDMVEGISFNPPTQFYFW